jgi:hypothetical protein
LTFDKESFTFQSLLGFISGNGKREEAIIIHPLSRTAGCKLLGTYD